MNYGPVLPACPPNVMRNDYDKIIEIHDIIMLDLSLDMPTISQLAAQANMSTSKFRNLFIKVFGMSIYQYHLNARLELAKQLLIENKHTIVQIAYKTGFYRSQSFAKAFFLHTGQTASQFRKSNL